jgi:asparagine synthase (glutamine-hydrolysing)
MSAVFALYRLDGQHVERESVERAVDTMVHRGPDGAGVWTANAVGLGHRMLHTTPESLHETLPHTHASGAFSITADARIDNREELIARLHLAQRPQPVTDSELILEAYGEWGEACVEHLLGAFAFAIWDERQRRLFCVRDHLGVKNIYYWHREGRLFACASEIKALLSLEDVPEEIDEVQLGTFFTKEILDADQTVFKGIRRLLPGHTLTITPDRLRSHCYWQPAPTTDPLPTTDEGYAERFFELFQEAVRCRLRSAFPVGSELSGGLDSSFVTCVARDLSGADENQPFPTISLVYDRFPQCDERTYIKEVVAQGGIEPHFVSAEQRGILDLLDEIYNYLDDGRAAGNHHLNWLTASAARKAGVRVLLSGQDGDTTVYHGWQYFIELAGEERWEEFAREASLSVQNMKRERGTYDMQETWRGSLDVLNAYGGIHLKQWAVEGQYLKFARSVNQISRHFKVPRREIYRRMFRSLLRPAAGAEARRRAGVAREARRALPAGLSPALAERIDLAERLAEHRLSREQDLSVRGAQLRTLQSPQLTFSFEKFGHYAAANGIEARHPFMDKRLVEYCLALPPNQSMSQGWTRVVMRRAMEGIVPDPIRWRVGKASLAAPFAYLFREASADRLKELMSGVDEAGQYLNLSHLKQQYERIERLDHKALGEFSTALGTALWLRKRKAAEERGRQSGPRSATVHP